MKLAPVPSCFVVLLTLLGHSSLAAEPKLNVKAICQSRQADAKMLRSTPEQTLADCIHDENAAKQQLTNVWASTSAVIRNRCQSDARSLGTMSYLDLVTCIQMEEEMKSGTKKP